MKHGSFGYRSYPEVNIEQRTPRRVFRRRNPNGTILE